VDPSATSPDPAASPHAVVDSYLSTLLAMAECLGQACPPVGGPYRQRLQRFEKRLRFDSSPEAIAETYGHVAQELEDYAAQAAAYLRGHEAELRRAAAGVGEILGELAQRQEFYAAQLSLLAAGEGPCGGQPGIGQQVGHLRACLENMGRESRFLVARMRDELAAVERRISEFEIADPVTGLVNRREMERRIRAATASGKATVLIRFDLGAPLPDDAARQVGARIASQFRYNDLACRWTESEFLVWFQGPLEVAQVRSGQVTPWVGGRYLLDSGEIANVRIANVYVEQGLVETGPAEAGTMETGTVEPGIDGSGALPSTPLEPLVSQT
jgi:hypothetical protein